MEKKRLGIIGGMGPKATSVFVDKLIAHTDAHRDQEHIDMVILNHASLPDRTEVIMSGKSEVFLNEIAKDIRLLEHAGVANIAIPCNTSHYFHREMQALTPIPIIHIVEETLQEIGKRVAPGSKIGVLATNGTLKSGIYREACEKYGMRYYEVDAATQDRVMHIIYNEVKRDLNVGTSEVESLILKLVNEAGCDCVIIACTELSCITLSDEVKAHCIDAMSVLVARSIERSGKGTIGLS